MAKLWMTVPFLILAIPTLSGGAASAAESSKHDPCSFLKVDEVETIMGSLAGAPYRARARAMPSPNGNDCRYETPDGRSIRLNVEWEGGKSLVSMMGATQALVEAAGLKGLKLLDGATVAGHWDQAAVNSCCEFNALRGDRVVTVDVAGSKATIAQAASLADAAIQRLDQPLNISGAAGIKAAEERATHRPKARNVCELLTQADAEAIAGVSLSLPPKGTNNECSYVWPLNAEGSEYEIKLMVTWQEGFSEMRTMRTAVGNASSMLGMDKLQRPTGADHNSGPWDEFSQSIVGVSAVKNDVMVSVEGGPVRQDVQQAFVGKAITNLGK